MEDIVEDAEEAAAAEVSITVVRPSTDPTRSGLLARRACVVWQEMRLRMP